MNEKRTLDPRLQFLKLGGSLITEKSQASRAKPKIMARLAGEIATYLTEEPESRLVLGHGSGSFGHVPAKKYGTREGVDSPNGWRGFAEVWEQAAALNRLVMEALQEEGVRAIAFPASSGAMAQDGEIAQWDLAPLQAALEAGLLPVVYGDVAFDSVRSGTILSTEEIFEYLCGQLRPKRILLAGQEPGVWEDYEARKQIVPEITPAKWKEIAAGVSGSAETDVTGGMASKVSEMLALTQAFPGLEVAIFSGEAPGAVEAALGGRFEGTLLRAN